MLQRTFSSLSADLDAVKEEEEKNEKLSTLRPIQTAHASLAAEHRKDTAELTSFDLQPPVLSLANPLTLSRETLGVDHIQDAMMGTFSPSSPYYFQNDGAENTGDEHRKNYSRAASSRVKRSKLKQPPPNFRHEDLKDVFPDDNDQGHEKFTKIEITDNESLLFGSTSRPTLPIVGLSLVDEDDALSHNIHQEGVSQDTPKRKVGHSIPKRKPKVEEPLPESPRGAVKHSPRAGHEKLGVKLSDEEYYHDLAMAQKAEGVEYVDSKDLQPVKSPAQEFQKALRGLETQEWPELFHTLTAMRRIVLYHPQVVLTSGALHSIVVLIMKQVENLRSSLAKNALITIADFFLGLKKGMDSELQAIVPGVVKVRIALK